MANADSRKALGRGLSTLLPTNRPAPAPPATAPPQTLSAPLRISIGDIDPNPLQPRTVFQAERLQELAQSIREHGIIQPLIVRAAGGDVTIVLNDITKFADAEKSNCEKIRTLSSIGPATKAKGPRA